MGSFSKLEKQTLVSFQRLQIGLVLPTRVILIVFEKLTPECTFFFQITFETILFIPILIIDITYVKNYAGENSVTCIGQNVIENVFGLRASHFFFRDKNSFR
jgi:hypothetical protein